MEAWYLYLQEVSDLEGCEAFKRVGASLQYGDPEPGHVIEKVMELQEELFQAKKLEQQKHYERHMREHEAIKADRYPLSNPVAAKGTPEHEEGKRKFRELILKAFPDIYAR